MDIEPNWTIMGQAYSWYVSYIQYEADDKFFKTLNHWFINKEYPNSCM